MIKPDERVLVALHNLNPSVVQWLKASLDEVHLTMEDAPREKLEALQGQAQAIRSILNSAAGALKALERIRSKD